MLFRTLGLCLLFVTAVSYAQGRRPAVEDFVGIESEHPDSTPPGTESLFNFEQDLTKHSEVGTTLPEESTKIQATKELTRWSLFSVVGLTMAISLPLFVWLIVMGHLRKKASLESVSNIEVLEKYRRERELSRKNEETIKKVS